MTPDLAVQIIQESTKAFASSKDALDVAAYEQQPSNLTHSLQLPLSSVQREVLHLAVYKKMLLWNFFHSLCGLGPDLGQRQVAQESPQDLLMKALQQAYAGQELHLAGKRLFVVGDM